MCLGIQEKKSYYDIVVVGGGMVGAAMSLALAQARFRVLIVDRILPVFSRNNLSPDLQVSAINYTSAVLLRRLKAWRHIDDYFRVVYHRLEVWERMSSVVTFDASLLNLPELGFIIENFRLKKALWRECINCEWLTLLCPISIDCMNYNKHVWRIKFNDGRMISSRLVIGADGAQSWVRKHAGIALNGWQYRQSCLVLSVNVKNIQPGVTWQAFYPSGPRALLPLYGNWASLVWYDDATYIRKLELLSLTELARKAREAFPIRLGEFTVHEVRSFPLIRQHVCSYIQPGLALIGDAAHTVHPLAGQGVNLGFRDVSALLEVLLSAREKNEPWNTVSILQRYQRKRQIDNLLMQTSIDALHMIFSSKLPPLILIRNLGLTLTKRISVIKRQILRYALGI